MSERIGINLENDIIETVRGILERGHIAEIKTEKTRNGIRRVVVLEVHKKLRHEITE